MSVNGVPESWKAVDLNGDFGIDISFGNLSSAQKFKPLDFSGGKSLAFDGFTVALPDNVNNDPKFDPKSKVVFALTAGYKNEASAPESFVVQKGGSYGSPINDLSTDAALATLTSRISLSAGYEKQMTPLIQEQNCLVVPYEPECQTDFIKFGEDYTLRFLLFSNQLLYLGRIGFCAQGRVNDLTAQALAWLKTIKATEALTWAEEPKWPEAPKVADDFKLMQEPESAEEFEQTIYPAEVIESVKSEESAEAEQTADEKNRLIIKALIAELKRQKERELKLETTIKELEKANKQQLLQASSQAQLQSQPQPQPVHITIEKANSETNKPGIGSKVAFGVATAAIFVTSLGRSIASNRKK